MSLCKSIVIASPVTGSDRSRRVSVTNMALTKYRIHSDCMPLNVANGAGELQDCLSKLVKHDVDVAGMRITLDIICLTLPLPDDTGRHSASSVAGANRTISLSSQLSFPGADGDLTPEVVTPSKAVTAISE